MTLAIVEGHNVAEMVVMKIIKGILISFKNWFSRLIGKLNNYAVLIASGAALVSALMAFLSWHYSREISKPAPALVNVDTKNVVVKDPNHLDINLTFNIKNVGKEKLVMSDIGVFRVDFRRGKYEQIGVKPVLNPIHSGCGFNYNVILTATGKKGSFGGDEKELKQKLPKLLEKEKQALVLRIVYYVCGKETEAKYFLRYVYPEVALLSEAKYLEIEEKLPDKFKVDK